MDLQTGNAVVIKCYKEGCEKVSIRVILGQQCQIEPGTVFTSAGRLHWKKGHNHKVFKLDERCKCPNCDTVFGDVVVVNKGRLIFGYDPEPA